MTYEQILYSTAGSVATITLNRPDKLNAWTRQMEGEFTDAVRTAAADDGVRAIVITGAGKGFCAGADMSLLSAAASGAGASGDGAGSPLEANVDFAPEARADFRKKHAWLVSVPKPVIAAINGPSVGLGFVIPLYCDFRIAAESAKFSVIFSKRGLVAEYGLAWILPRIVGLPNAIDLVFTSRLIDAAEAQRMGLVSRVLPDADFAGAAQAFAQELANTVSPRSLRVMKRQMYEAQLEGLGPSVDLAMEEMRLSFSGEDFKEGVAHFLEKRAPKFTGR
jgi:enoyl-CoA hydratase/carnithine racemase